jgi:predicted nucleic acid-binding protein
MKRFVDSNILCRFANRADPQHEETRQALDSAIGQGDELLISPQVEREFWVVATRPRERNGLGMQPDEVEADLKAWREAFFTFVPDSFAVHEAWRDLVNRHAVSGKQAHDAGIVAAAQTAHADQILTFNTEDFRRFEPEIAIATPRELIREHQRRLALEQRAAQEQARDRGQDIER